MAEQQAQTESGSISEGSSENKEKELQAKLTEANLKTAEASLYAKMMQDPEFSQILQARAAGKKVKVLPEDQINPQKPQSLVDELVPKPEEVVDFDKMDQKQLFAYHQRETAKLMEKVIDKKLGPVNQKLELFEQSTVSNLKDKAQQQVDAVRKDYPDFDQHLGTIAKLNAANPQLTAMQLYVLAKAEAGQPVVKGQNLASEKPSTTGARPQAKPGHKPKTLPGQNSMLALRDVIHQSAANLLASGALDEGLDE